MSKLHLQFQLLVLAVGSLNTYLKSGQAFLKTIETSFKYNNSRYNKITIIIIIYYYEQLVKT